MIQIDKKWWIRAAVAVGILLVCWATWAEYSSSKARVAKAERLAEEASQKQEQMQIERTAFERDYQKKVQAFEATLKALARDRDEMRKKLEKQEEIIARLRIARQDAITHVYTKIELDRKFADILRRSVR